MNTMPEYPSKNSFFLAETPQKNTWICTLEIVQDFLIMLDIKPLMHLLEMSIFSLNNDLKILSFKVIFKCLKLGESLQKILWRIFD